MNPFEPEDIEDVRIIIKAKGKNYSIIPNRDITDDDEAKDMRISTLSLLMPFHKVVDTSLEDLNK